MLTPTLAACCLLLRCLALGEVTTVGPLTVARSSLCGYSVACGGIVKHGLDEVEAAPLVARAAALSVAQQKVAARAPEHPELLKAPAVDGLDLLVRETWKPGRAATNRAAALRRRTPYVTQRTRRDEVELAYPQGINVPAIEVAS